MRFHYCPLCGHELALHPAGDDGEVPYCEHCRRYWFDSFASCSIVLVANEEHEIMLLEQGYLSHEHKTCVAGYIKPGETAEECTVREVKEEIGQEIEQLVGCGTYWFGEREQLMHGFIGLVHKRPLITSAEVDAAHWIPADEAPAHMFPNRPGNMQHILYRRYLDLIGGMGTI